MIQGEDEILEDYVEQFQYNLQKSKHKHLTKEILKTLLLKGIKATFLELLNLMEKGDVFQLSYDDICELCIRYSRGISRVGKNSREISSFSSKSATKTRDIGAEINDLFEHFKTDFISSLNSKLNVLRVNTNQEKSEEVFFPQCRKKYPMDSCSFLPGMKKTYQRDQEDATSSQPWKSWPKCMVQNNFSSFYYLHYSSWNTLMLGKPCQPHYDPHQSCPQVWHGSYYDYMITLSHLLACQTYHPYSSLNPPRPTQIPVQSIPHPHNNKPIQHAYNVELQNFLTLPTHPISTAPLHETDIRYGKTLNL
jgi:hypothetical protein